MRVISASGRRESQYAAAGPATPPPTMRILKGEGEGMMVDLTWIDRAHLLGVAEMY